MITKKKADKCTTHHACDCLRYKMQEMESALKVIHIWAQFDHMVEDIEKKAQETLNCLDDHR